ncbi:MAG: LacI family transcriptional regulator [Anaerolineae bacterium]|nr:LacI family transcriptional regulator [Anaerolineae bacterium]
MPIVTIQTVADYARVSRATVSRVLNNNPKVDSEIRERVLQAVEILGYQPNRVARRLRTQSRDVIGVIISDIQNPHFTSIIRGIEDVAYVRQMNIVLCNSDEDSSKLQTYLRVMQAESVAGLIVVPTHADQEREALQSIQRNGIPIILLDREIEGFEVDSVQVDHRHGAYEAVAHLIRLGRRRIGIIYNDFSTGWQRYQGYIDALNEAHIPIDRTLVKTSDHKRESSYDRTRELMALPVPPDALFTAFNLVTLGALHVLHELGARVPQDVALVGFDDMPWADELFSPLTAVAQPTYELGQTAARLLLRRLNTPDAPFQNEILPTQLIVRQSCGSAL